MTQFYIYSLDILIILIYFTIVNLCTIKLSGNMKVFKCTNNKNQSERYFITNKTFRKLIESVFV